MKVIIAIMLSLAPFQCMKMPWLVLSLGVTIWSQVTHIYVGEPAIIWTNGGILLIGTLGINFSEI